jgi:hypothetical protein
MRDANACLVFNELAKHCPSLTSPFVYEVFPQDPMHRDREVRNEETPFVSRMNQEILLCELSNLGSVFSIEESQDRASIIFRRRF